MPVLTYDTFDLIVEKLPGGSYRARVVDPPSGGRPYVDFAWPSTGTSRWQPKTGLSRGSRHFKAVDPDQQPPPGAETIGRQLYATIFAGDIGASLLSSLTLSSQRGKGLRIRLHVDEVPELANLPWEALYVPERSRFLVLSHETPLVRYIDVRTPAPSLPVDLPLRILAVIASPAGYPELNVEEEWRRLEGALADLQGRGKVVVSRLDPPTLPALQARLRQEDFHVLHFIGHGVFDREGSLLFEGNQGNAALVSATDLGTILHSHDSLRLTFLNACEGAQSGTEDAFAGVAQRLVQQEIPAVIAMQAPISDAAAIVLAQEFYAALVDGYPVDAALAEGRKTLATQGYGEEWVTPVLFSRAPDGYLFDILDVLATPSCPYPGMAPFTASEADRFYGRRTEIQEAVAKLRLYPFLAVIGPSGSGKSSLVAAGILPAAAASSFFGHDKLAIKSMRPGSNPLARLAGLLGMDVASASSDTPDQAVGAQQPGRPPLQALVNAAAANAPLLLVVDQFEELYQSAPAAEAMDFQQALLQIAQAQGVYCIIAGRADFYPDFMNAPLWPLVREHRLEVTSLRGESLRAAIVQPAADVEVEIDPALVERLLADSAGEPGVLPFVQETLVLLWDHVKRRRLSLDAYTTLASGPGGLPDGRSGLQAAMAARAEQAFLALDEAKGDQMLARRIFLRLVQFGEGRPDTRRQLAVDELGVGAGDPAQFDRVLEHLVVNRLLIRSGEEAGACLTVDIAHEALLAGWPRLHDWIDARRTAEQARRRLEEAAEEWEALGRGSDGLLGALRLQESQNWLNSPDAADLGASPSLRDLVAASRADLEREKREQQRNLRFRVGAGIAVAALIIVALVIFLIGQRNQIAIQNARATEQANSKATIAAGATAESQARDQSIAAEATAEARRQEAERNQRKAESRAFGARGQEMLAQPVYDPSLVLLLSIQAVTTTLGPDGTVDPDADRALQSALLVAERSGWHMSLPREYHTGEVHAVAFSPDGKTIVSASEDQTARLWDASTGEERLLLVGHAGGVWDAEFSPDGRTIATTGQDGTLRFWDPATGRQLGQWKAHDGRARSLAYSPDGKRIVTAGQDGTARVWAVATGNQIMQLEFGAGWVLSARFSPDGSTIVTTANDKTARLWDASTGQAIATLSHDSWPRNAAFTPDSRRLVTIDQKGFVRAWDTATGAELASFPPQTFTPEMGRHKELNSIAFTSDGNLAVTADMHGQVLVRDGKNGRIEDRLLGHVGGVNSASFSPDGRFLVTGGEDHTVRAWDVAARREVLTIGGHVEIAVAPGVSANDVRGVAFDPASTQLATTGRDGIIRVWDVQTGRVLTVTQAHTDTIRSIAFSPNAGALRARLVTASADKTARIWNATTGEPISVLRGYTATVLSAAFSPDGRFVVTAGEPASARIWDSASGREIRALVGHTDTVRSAVYSPDGLSVLTASEDGSARLWDAATGRELRQYRRHTGAVLAVTFGPDGHTMVTGSQDGTAIVWEVETGRPLVTVWGHAGGVNSVAFSADGKTLLTASTDKSARLWDVETGRLLRSLQGHGGTVYRAVFSPDEQMIATASADGTARLWNYGPTYARRELTGHTGLVRYAAFSPDDKRLVSAGEDRRPRLWDAATGRELLRLTGHTEAVWSAEFSPAGDKILTASQDGTIRLWDTATARELISATVAISATEDTLGVNYAGYNHAGTLIVTAGNDRTVRLWDAQAITVTRVLTGHGQAVLTAAFSPDDRLLATSSADGSARLWAVATGVELRSFLGHNDWVWSVAFSSTGDRIVTAGGDGTARVWDVADGEELLILRGHTGLVRTAQFSPDGKTIITAGEDGTARLWDAATICAQPHDGCAQDLLFGHTDDVWYAGFSHDGRTLVTASFDRTLRLWDPSIQAAIDHGYSLIQRDPPLFTLEERQIYSIGQP